MKYQNINTLRPFTAHFIGYRLISVMRNRFHKGGKEQEVYCHNMEDLGEVGSKNKVKEIDLEW